MEKQIRLVERNDLIDGVEPIIKIVKNISMSAGAKIIEITIQKVYVIPN